VQLHRFELDHHKSSVWPGAATSQCSQQTSLIPGKPVLHQRFD